MPREVLTQAIDYASDVATWDIDKVSEVCMQYNNQALHDYLSENIMGIELDDLVINKAQRLLLVGFSIEEPLNRMVEFEYLPPATCVYTRYALFTSFGSNYPVPLLRVLMRPVDFVL